MEPRSLVISPIMGLVSYKSAVQSARSRFPNRRRVQASLEEEESFQAMMGGGNTPVEDKAEAKEGEGEAEESKKENKYLNQIKVLYEFTK